MNILQCSLQTTPFSYDWLTTLVFAVVLDPCSSAFSLRISVRSHLNYVGLPLKLDLHLCKRMLMLVVGISALHNFESSVNKSRSSCSAKNGCRTPAGKVFTQFHLQFTMCTRCTRCTMCSAHPTCTCLVDHLEHLLIAAANFSTLFLPIEVLVCKYFFGLKDCSTKQTALLKTYIFWVEMGWRLFGSEGPKLVLGCFGPHPISTQNMGFETKLVFFCGGSL